MTFRNFSFLSEAGPDVLNNKEFILNAIKFDGRAYEYASDELKRDADVLHVILGFNVEGVHKVIERAIKYHGDNKDIMTRVLKHSGLYLQEMSEEMRDDDDIVSAAIENNGYAFKYASKRLRSSKKIVARAVARYPDVYNCVSKAMKNDRDIVLLALEHSGGSLMDKIPRALCDDAEICFAAIKRRRGSFKYVSDRLKNDPEFMMKLLEYNL